MREEGVPREILVHRHNLILVTLFQLIAPGIALISRSAGIAGSLMDQDALNATSTPHHQHLSVTMVQSANK